MATTTLPREDQQDSSSRDAEILGGDLSTLWHKTAPKTVTDAYERGKHRRGWKAWCEHLSSRKKPKPLAALVSGKTSPLAWALPDELAGRDSADLIDRLHKLGGKAAKKSDEDQWSAELRPWLAEADGAAIDAGYALECLAWANSLSPLTGRVPADLWWELLEHLVAVVSESRQIDLHEQPLVHQLLAGELAWTLSSTLPEIKVCRKLDTSAKAALLAGLIELLDGEGILASQYLPQLRPLLACWTRSHLLSDGKCFTKSAATQYEWFVTFALRLTRRDGTQVFSGGSAGAWSADLFTSALACGGNESDEEVAAAALPGSRFRTDTAPRLWTMPDAATNSEWATLAVLRPEWSRGGERFTVDYGGRRTAIELETGGDVICSGEWSLDVQRDGAQLKVASDWEEVCWLSDEDVDYLELHADLSDGTTVQRQFLLAREDRFLYLADVIVGEKSGDLQYHGTLPLGDEIAFAPAKETSEGVLHSKKRRLNVLPLSLSEWRSDSRDGQLAVTDEGLQLRMSRSGVGLCAATWIDLDPSRRKKPLTWRRLTVAQDRKLMPADAAVGFRVQVGSQQWLIYRSLAPPANRTVLGNNLIEEFLLGRFLKSGEVEAMVEVE